MIKEAINRILELAEPMLVECGGQQYATKKLTLVTNPAPTPLMFHSLTGMSDYLKSGIDVATGLPETWALLVNAHDSVSLISRLDDQALRHHLASCTLSHPSFAFGSWFDQETFIISLQSLFKETPARGQLLACAGSVTEEAIQISADDGVSQTATAKAGVALANRVTLPNPVELQPWRTFREIDQPTSKFVFRVRKANRGGVEFALFEADGGVWRHEAMKSIAAWLKEQVGKAPVVLA